MIRIGQPGKFELIHGDCLDALPTIPLVDAVVTDPGDSSTNNVVSGGTYTCVSVLTVKVYFSFVAVMASTV